MKLFNLIALTSLSLAPFTSFAFNSVHCEEEYLYDGTHSFDMTPVAQNESSLHVTGTNRVTDMGEREILEDARLQSVDGSARSYQTSFGLVTFHTDSALGTLKSAPTITTTLACTVK